MHPWKTTMQLGPTSVRLLMTDEDNREILKACLPLRPTHYRAAPMLLEALALWAGHPLTVALVAGGRSAPTFGAWIFGPEGWPEATSLLRFEALPPRRLRRRTLPGVGDFRQLRLLHRDGRLS